MPEPNFEVYIRGFSGLRIDDLEALAEQLHGGLVAGLPAGAVIHQAEVRHGILQMPTVRPLGDGAIGSEQLPVVVQPASLEVQPSSNGTTPIEPQEGPVDFASDVARQKAAAAGLVAADFGGRKQSGKTGYNTKDVEEIAAAKAAT